MVNVTYHSKCHMSHKNIQLPSHNPCTVYFIPLNTDPVFVDLNSNQFEACRSFQMIGLYEPDRALAKGVPRCEYTRFFAMLQMVLVLKALELTVGSCILVLHKSVYLVCTRSCSLCYFCSSVCT